MFASAQVARAIAVKLAEAGNAEAMSLVSQPHAPNRRSSYRELASLVVEAMNGDPGVGLTLGSTMPLRALQFLYQLVFTCSTLREAHEVLAKYGPLISDGITWKLAESREDAWLIHEHACQDEVCARFAAELTGVILWRFVAGFLPSTERPRLLTWRHAEPLYAERYLETFRCAQRFSQHSNALVLPRPLLDRRQPHADATLNSILRAAMDEQLDRIVAGNPWAEKARYWLASRPDLKRADLQAAAGSIGVRYDYLRRQLRSEGCSWSGLVNEERRNRAFQALRNGDSIGRVSTQIGFSDTSAFHRAFRRWSGSTPSTFRRSHRPTTPSDGSGAT